jgi:phosphoribosylformylglycinamidine synthase II
MQDMGAAGICCSTAEMSAKSGTGMKIDLNKVPLREQKMSAYEIMLSESQERMLVVVTPENVQGIKTIFDKWDLEAEIIGEVTSTGRVVIDYQGERVADIPAGSLALGGDMTPVYHRDSVEPAYLLKTRAFDVSSYANCADAGKILRILLASPIITSKRWIYEQYDSMVRTNTLFIEGSDAAVIRVKGTLKGLAVKTDCNSRYVYLDPYRGGMIAVVEAARNIACTGATPVGVTNCLNFGNPYDPEVFFQFKEAVRGMGDACRTLETPVTGGNVSFYNESPDGAIYPTPTIGMLGIIDDVTKVVSSSFKNQGDAIVLLRTKPSGDPLDGLGGSEYLRILSGEITGNTPSCDLEGESKLIQLLIELADKQMVNSAHDVSEGGIAVTLAECCFAMNTGRMFGAHISIPLDGASSSAMFAERQGQVVVSTHPDEVDRVLSLAKQREVEALIIGRVTQDSLEINDLLKESVAQLFEVYSNALSTLLETSESLVA